MPCALAVASLSAAACHDGDAVAAPESARELALQRSDADCIDFQGLRHCPLGAARLTAAPDGRLLEVNGLSDPRSDGVSILLPDVTGFFSDGQIDGARSGTTLTASAFQAGAIVGSMTLQQTDGGYLVSATFTGSGGGSPYQVNLYDHDAVVGRITGMASGQQVFMMLDVDDPICGTVYGPYPPPPPFENVQVGPNVGACIWHQSLAGCRVQAVLDDGRIVGADRIDLEEVIPGGSSYPYMSFNRIDYTTNGVGMKLSGERIQ
jgi:hypothetical protein